MKAIVNLEGTSAHSRVNAVIVRECREGEPFNPVVLEVIDEDPKVFFNLLIDSFSLSISLGMIGGGYVCLNLKQVIKVFHELGYEHGASVRDDHLRHSVFCVYFVV